VERALDDRRVRDVLISADVLHSAVRTTRGPHLTPTAVSWEADRLWAVAPKDSVKVRALRRDPRVGVLLSIDGFHVVAAGHTQLVDPLELPTSNRVSDLLRLPFGAARYLTENSRHAVGVVLDDPNPFALIDRVGLSIRLKRVALLDGEKLVNAWGDWPEGTLLPTEPAEAERFTLPARTPAWAARLLARDRWVQFGWRTLDGPLALPARWSADDQRGRTSGDLMALVGALPSGPACLTSSHNSYRMSEKTGVLLRGDATAALADDGSATMSITPKTVTYWRGKQARTFASGAAEGGATK
jgi:hypothetical protein